MKYLSVSLEITLDNINSAIKLGIAISPFAISEKFHTNLSSIIAPIRTKLAKTILYKLVDFSPKIYSNALDLNIKALPSETNLIGDFDIKASVNKSDIKSGEAISFKLEIKGSGNIEDIKDIKLNIPNTTIYENKASVNASYKNNK